MASVTDDTREGERTTLGKQQRRRSKRPETGTSLSVCQAVHLAANWRRRRRRHTSQLATTWSNWPLERKGAQRGIGSAPAATLRECAPMVISTAKQTATTIRRLPGGGGAAAADGYFGCSFARFGTRHGLEQLCNSIDSK